VKAGPWRNWDEFRAWWDANVIALNRLAVTDPDAWERVTIQIEAFYQLVPWTPPK
jgi:hypothetical protein